MIISLTGFMGCGKSSVGRRLSQLLCCPFMDLDQVIEERTGRTIPEIFATEGEAAFRAMELEILKGIFLHSDQERFPKQSLPSQAMGPSLCGQRGSTVSGPSSDHHHTTQCQFRTSALTPIENLDCHHEASSCHHEASSCHPEASSCHPERSEGSINLVLALGGGTVMTPECADIVKERTCCIYLKASIDTLMEHLSGEADGRPMLSGDTLHERITKLMTQRSDTYEKTTHIIIDTDGKSVEAIASEIVSMLNI
jgi:shikimate kinase